jgi:hypothetical protein
MRKRLMLIAAPLCVVAVAASVAVAAPSDAEHSRGPKLDKLHAERPTAAYTGTAAVAVAVGDVARVHEFLSAIALTDFLNGIAVRDFLGGVAAEEAAQASALAPRASGAVYSSTNPGGFLDCVRQRESSGNYAVYNAGGSGAAGAYQFMPGTWNSIAASSGRADLVGVDPAQAAPADQDAMAAALYAQQGSGPWGGSC